MMALIYYVIAPLVTVFYSVASAERCVQHHVLGNDTYHSCSEGCCYSYIYPCCEKFIFDTTAFKVSMAVCGVITLLACILFIIRWRTVNSRPRQQMAAGTAVYPGVAHVNAYGHTNGAFSTQPVAGMPNTAYPTANYAYPTPNPGYPATHPAYSNIGVAPPAYKEREEMPPTYSAGN